MPCFCAVCRPRIRSASGVEYCRERGGNAYLSTRAGPEGKFFQSPSINKLALGGYPGSFASSIAVPHYELFEVGTCVQSLVGVNIDCSQVIDHFLGRRKAIVLIVVSC